MDGDPAYSVRAGESTSELLREVTVDGSVSREEAKRQENTGAEHRPEFSQGNFSGSGNFNTETDVILGAEYISDREARALLAYQQLAVVLGLGLLTWLVTARYMHSPTWWLQSHALPWVNLGVGVLCLLILLPCCGVFAWRALKARQQRRRWSQRRLRMAVTTAAELGTQTVCIGAWVGLNAWTVTQPCPGEAWGHATAAVGLVIWTCLNTVLLLLLVQVWNQIPASVLGKLSLRLPIRLPVINPKLRSMARQDDSSKRAGMLVMDLSWWYVAPASLLWLADEAVIVAFFVRSLHDVGKRGPTRDCKAPTLPQDLDCSVDGTIVTLASAMFVTFCLDLALFCGLMWVAFRAFAQRPYMPFRAPNMNLRFMLKVRLITAMLFLLCIVLLWFAQLGSCAAFLEMSLGWAPMQLGATTLMVVTSEMYLPRLPKAKEVDLNVWLQDFAWVQSDLPRKLSERQARREEPMFCFELALKLMYWAALVYYAEVDCASGSHTLGTALGLLGLRHHEVFYDPRSHCKCIVAWGARSVLVAFRGTASLANVVHDIKVWQVVHPPKRGSYWLASRPMVHSGFWQTYCGSQLRGWLISKLTAVLSSGGGASRDGGSGSNGSSNSGAAGPNWDVYFTGHSLGGALATLAAWDCARYLGSCAPMAPTPHPHPEPQLQLAPCSVHCYTYGAPRTGNHAFAREYVRCVPNTWQIVNDQDAVAKAGKFLFMFKHCGHKVIINPQGDMVVRPTYLEASVHRGYRASVAQHFLTSYRASFRAIMKAQFAGKGSQAGRQALRDLSRCEYVQDMLVGTLKVEQVTMSHLLSRPSLVEDAASPTDTDLASGAVVTPTPSAARLGPRPSLPAAATSPAFAGTATDAPGTLTLSTARLGPRPSLPAAGAGTATDAPGTPMVCAS